MSDPAVPEPDTKDWTWVIHEPCPDCGFDPRPVAREDVPHLTRHYTAAVTAAVATPGASSRPTPATWSALEYACHVRDVCDLGVRRLALMLAEDDPTFANWDQDDTALAERYWEQDPAQVQRQLTRSADELATAFAGVRGAQWERPGRRSNGSLFTVDTFARYLLHDLAHHAWDVTGERQPAR